MPAPDAMLFDFSYREWHFGLDSTVAVANTYPETPLLLYDWGCVNAPEFPALQRPPPPCPTGSSTPTG